MLYNQYLLAYQVTNDKKVNVREISYTAEISILHGKSGRVDTHGTFDMF